MTRFNPRTPAVLALLLAVAALRVIFSTDPHLSPLAVFTPIGAMALFGGACFSNRVKAFGWPLLTLWISDLLLDRFVFYGHWRLFYENFYWTYGAFALMVVTGRLLLRKVTVTRVLLATVLSVLIHWIVTDFGVWLEGTMYPKTGAGFVECLVAAIPYERFVLAGTLVYGTILFGSFAWMNRHHRALQPAIQ
ncbi:DUF6580 family putative transport protein [Dinghuibacter silviterrae]|uniref:Uncharacterized protein n=1 Tax=Dinghuibacter silviterrae TaxID=1539049 RepID=A0A4R8DPR2_9BACT|nr:DUF6580 family putative transport protein [Dinghuibacter silviterrae]TDX00082.1 hypothetical protein EDB95_1099 [Dinghuibacter silviterrae]